MKRKNFFQAMYVASLVLIVTNPCMMAKAKIEAKPQKQMPGTAIFVMAPVEDVRISDKTLNCEDPSIDLEMKIPQFNGLADSKAEKNINKLLMTEAKKRKKQVCQEAKAYYKDMTQDEIQVRPFEYVEDYLVIHSSEPYFVVEQFRYQYSGGAHGDTNLTYLVLDKRQSKLITMKDLFRADIDHKKVVDPIIRAQIEARKVKGAFFFEGSEGFQTIKDDQPFFINGQNELVVVFNTYEIAPYAAGPQFFNIPLGELTAYLK